MRLSITETVTTFVVIPAAVLLVVGGLTYAAAGRSTSRRYRPGRPFEFTPVWFLAAPERPATRAGSAEITAGAQRRALTGMSGSGGSTQEAAVQLGGTGGTSDRW